LGVQDSVLSLVKLKLVQSESMIETNGQEPALERRQREVTAGTKKEKRRSEQTGTVGGGHGIYESWSSKDYPLCGRRGRE